MMFPSYHLHPDKQSVFYHAITVVIDMFRLTDCLLGANLRKKCLKLLQT
jgi:hypothetical protein